jgi:alpha-ketoglutarate-dependent taurine dioxygenase
VQVHDGWLRVSLPSGRQGDFHLRWLRHNDDLDRHPLTGERTVDSSELPDDLGVLEAECAGDVLVVRWRDDPRVSRYSLGWLDEHAYAVDREAVPRPPADVGAIEIAAPSGDPSVHVESAIALLRGRGAAIVRRGRSETPPEAQTERIVDAFTEAGLRVVETHFGRIEDLRTDNTTNQNTDQLGYTNSGIELHTDQPFLDVPPRYQMLQSIRSAPEGGDNTVVDAKAAAAYLASTDLRAWELLRTVPVTFHRKQRAFERTVVAPVLSDEGDRFQVRYSYFTMAPHRLPFDRMEEWYRAYDRFARLVRDPRHGYAFALRPGDFLIYDNFRMLHARTAFRGMRWVRGVYFDRRT